MNDRQRRLTRSRGVDGSPAWSPDGRRIACGCERQGNFDIYLLSLSGNARRLTRGSAIEADPTWSPDGRKITFESKLDGSSEIDVVHTDGSGRRMLTSNGADPAWSADGRTIAFVRNGDVYLMDAAGSNPRRLARGEFPAWLP